MTNAEHAIKREITDKLARRIQEEAGLTRKAFTVIFESSPSTRWLYSEAELIRTLHAVAESAAEVNTRGPKPRVIVRQQTAEQLIPPLH